MQPTYSNEPGAASSSESKVNAAEMGRTAEDLIDAKRGAVAGGLDNVLADVQRIVRNNPGPVLLTAAALGFLIARAFSRD